MGLRKFSSFIFLVVSFVVLIVIVLVTNNQLNNESNKSVNGNYGTFTEEQQKSLSTLEKIDDHPLYVMTYYGDYEFKEYLKKGLDLEESMHLEENAWSCSCFGALNKNGEKIFGRNFDWRYSPKLILFTDSSDGYASVSMVDLSYLGFWEDKDLEELNKEEMSRLLSAPYFTFDGMNECGLAIGEMTVAGSKSSINPNKVTLGSLSIMRLVLDYAKNVDEAIALFNQYNVYFPPGPPLHYQISDVYGNSAIIEFINGEMKIIKNENPWQVSTNFFVYGSGDIIKRACPRYTTADNYLRDKNGIINEKEAIELLDKISQPSTQWSTVYNMTTGNIKVVMGRKYDTILEFKLNMKR